METDVGAYHFRRVEVRVWRDRKFRELSDRGKLLWMRLLTDPDLSSLGVLPHGLASLAEDMNWTVKDLAKVAKELVAAELVGIDAEARLIVLWNYVRYNPPTNPKHVAGWNSQVRDLPECDLLTRYCAHVRELVRAHNAEAEIPVPIPFPSLQNTPTDTAIDTPIDTTVHRARVARAETREGDIKGEGEEDDEPPIGGSCSDTNPVRSEPPSVPAELVGLRLFESSVALCRNWSRVYPDWQKSFPTLDLPAEIKKCHAYLLGKEAEEPRKKGKQPKYGARLANWFNTALRFQSRDAANNGARQNQWNRTDPAILNVGLTEEQTNGDR